MEPRDVTVVALTLMLATTFLELLRTTRALDSARRHAALNPHAPRLGRACEVRNRGRWVPCTVVAVSWKGALCVRERCGGTWWIRKDQVEERVRWEE